MTDWRALAIILVAGVLALVDVICITVLLVSGVDVPGQFWDLLTGASGAAVLGGAFTQGAATGRNHNG